jgi:RNA polymerase sigma-70 factor (ECF subfamily)
MSLADRFLARVADVDRPAGVDRERLEALLAGIVDAAEAAWPTVRIPVETFVTHLAAHAPAAPGLVEDLRTSDLYLACACALGDPAALAAFEATYFGDIGPALARMTRAPISKDDVAQEARRTLFLPRERTPPQIALYAGRGDLRNWTRAALVRIILNLVTRSPREVPAPSDLLDAVPSAGADPELAHMKEVYRAEFREAFSLATASLSSRERNLLRHAFVDGLGIDEVGALFGVHRATAARWLAAARAKLLGHVRKHLLQKLAVNESELASIMRLIRTDLGLTLRRHLGAPEPE